MHRSSEASASPRPAPPIPPPAVPPAIESVTRQGNFDFAATFDGDLVKAYDGDAASYWSDMEFATENWGGLAPHGVTLAVELERAATVSSITLSQLGGSGGNITVYTNDRPSMDGAKRGNEQLHLHGPEHAACGTRAGPVRDRFDQFAAQARSTQDPVWLRTPARRNQGPVAGPAAIGSMSRGYSASQRTTAPAGTGAAMSLPGTVILKERLGDGCMPSDR